MSLKVFVNSQLCDKEDARVSVYDHGLLYGDGVFEGIRAYNGTIFRCREHVERLYESARAILLDIPMTPEELTKAMYDTMAANGLVDAYLRVVVTRGIGTLGLNPFSCPDPQVIIIANSIALYPKEYYEKGLEVITCATQRNVPNAVNPRIKSLNYLNNILGKIEALQAGVMEAIMLNAQGMVAECTGDNVFIVKKGVLVTPPADAGALLGITRKAVMMLAREDGITVQERQLSRFEVHTADECFLTGTAAEVIPVVKVDSRVIGDGKPGPTTLRLLELFRQEIVNNPDR